jgi:hypothetical protein
MKQSSFTALSTFSAIAALMAALALGFAAAIAADLPVPPAGLTAPPKPTAMPAFDLPTTAGGTFRSESLRGQIVIVRYWASW